MVFNGWGCGVFGVGMWFMVLFDTKGFYKKNISLKELKLNVIATPPPISNERECKPVRL